MVKIRVGGKEIEIFSVSLKGWLETGKVEAYTDENDKWVEVDKPKKEPKK